MNMYICTYTHTHTYINGVNSSRGRQDVVGDTQSPVTKWALRRTYRRPQQTQSSITEGIRTYAGPDTTANNYGNSAVLTVDTTINRTAKRKY